MDDLEDCIHGLAERLRRKIKHWDTRFRREGLDNELVGLAAATARDELKEILGHVETMEKMIDGEEMEREV